MTLRFVLVGCAAEFSLRRLAVELERCGHAVLAVDLAEGPLNLDAVPNGEGPLVMVSSQHLTGTAASLSFEGLGIPAHYRSPQALKQQLGADLWAYVPHDLENPVLACEAAALGAVDLYCAPDHDSWWAAKSAPTVVTGWVNDWGDSALIGDVAGVLFLTSVTNTIINGGIDHLQQVIPNTLNAGLAVKLPVMSAAAQLSDDLVAAGLDVLDPALSASAVARAADLIVTNGPSSVLAESCRLGHRPLCVQDPTLAAVYRAAVRDVDAVVCEDADFGAARALAGRVRDPGAPFDLEAFLAAVGEAATT